MENRTVVIGGESIAFSLRRSTRKTLGISVLPNGDIEVTAPQSANLAKIEELLKKRAGWILDKKSEFAGQSVKASPRQFSPGETFLYLGQQYRLKVDPNRSGVTRDGARILVGGVQGGEASRIRNRLVRWYAKEARRVLHERFEIALIAFRQEIAIRPKLLIRPLRVRWGSYSSRSSSLTLSRALVQVPTPLIDYVIYHELTHAIHGDHGRGFVDFLSSKMPNWKYRKAALERLGPELFEAPNLP